MIKSDLEKDKEVKKEFNKIKKIFKDMPEDKKKLNLKLMYHAAWLAVSLDNLTETMDKDGVVIEYKNGENQYGTKKSPEAELYTSWSKQYTTVMKQLSDLLPKGAINKTNDPLMEFIKR
ncbi:hypothetical protein [Bacillus sp. BP-3]|uniref:hypothetical protein n=1 Tax=Bacillus sp. BP-3 TaxID=3022773 RepID=UPI00232F904C|nr:hypothetical protein [Bacillus sp. BP-3]MDC2866523.1 hypothetical protein [Bacillus sp. BP-3]